MRNKWMIGILFQFFTLVQLRAQEDFYSKGTLQYEYKINNHQNVSSSDDEDNVWQQNFIENMPKFSTYYYTLRFAKEKSIFTYKGKEETAKKMWGEDQLEDNIWFMDFAKMKYFNQKNIFGEIYKLEDSIGKIKWKISPNENREFAGFNCKKAVGILFDSVYVFAFYTDAITVSGGPFTINSLPGMVLGITIPRLHISCIATSFNPIVNENEIIPPKKGKIKSVPELQQKIKDATKDWGSYGTKEIWKGFL